MADVLPDRMLLIVTGSTLRAEEVDRPLAYYLKQRLEERLAELTIDPITVQVIADFRWLNDDPLQSYPSISVGGPGVNALAGRFYEQLPFALAIDEQYCIQMDPAIEDLRVSIWGMDNPKTQIAVGIFVERFLPRWLEGCARFSFEGARIDPLVEDEDAEDVEDEDLDLDV